MQSKVIGQPTRCGPLYSSWSKLKISHRRENSMLPYFIHFIRIKRILCGKMRWYESSYETNKKIKKYLKAVESSVWLYELDLYGSG